jgi:hypothetical protein
MYLLRLQILRGTRSEDPSKGTVEDVVGIVSPLVTSNMVEKNWMHVLEVLHSVGILDVSVGSSIYSPVIISTLPISPSLSES